MATRPASPPTSALSPVAADRPADPRVDRLVLVAPRAFWRPVSEALAVSGVHVTGHERPASSSSRCDPYGIDALARLVMASSSSPDGLLLVAPTRRGPRGLLPGPLLSGLPVGIVQADTPAELDPWLTACAGVAADRGASPPRRAVLAMGTNRFLDLGDELLSRLAPLEPLDWRADRLSRSSLAARLATGPAFALYVGHGRARGWSGYQAFRWCDVAAEPQCHPSGTVVALACDTLTRHRMVVPFGVRLVGTGRACAYLGVAASLPTTVAETLARVAADCLVADAPRTVGDLLRAVDARLVRDGEVAARRALSGFRLVGSPLAPV